MNKITINLEFGSPFQREVNEEMISLTLSTIKYLMETKHKGNKMNIKYADTKTKKSS